MEIRAQEVANWKSIEIFCCYARQDQLLLIEFKKHLIPLQREGLITLWADTDISAGTEWENEIRRHLNAAQIILLLISSDFMASEYCYSKEMRRAVERHEHGEALVIPIILRPVSWQTTPFGKFQALPTNANPITSGKWHHQDDAFHEVAEGIRGIVETRLAKESIRRNEEVKQAHQTEGETVHPEPYPLDHSEGSFTDPPLFPNLTKRDTVVEEAASLSLTPIHPEKIRQADQESSHSPFLSETSKDALELPQDLQTEQTTEATSKLDQESSAADRPQVSRKRGPTVSRRAVIAGTIAGGIIVVNTVIFTSNVKNIPFVNSGTTLGTSLPKSTPGTTLYTYRGNKSGIVSSLVWSPDSKRIASAESDAVRVWNPLTGGNVLTYQGHTCSSKIRWGCGVLSVAWSPDGKRIASSGQDNTVQVWNPLTGERDFTYYGRSDRVSNDGQGHNEGNAVAWSPDGKYIASISWDGTQIWEAQTAKVVYTSRGDGSFYSRAVNNAAMWSPSGKYIASGRADGTVEVWEALTGRNVLTHNGPSYSGYDRKVFSVAWSPDGKYIASGSASKHRIQVFDANNGNNIFTYDSREIVDSVTWSPDSKHVASGAGNAVQIWETQTGRNVLSYGKDDPSRPSNVYTSVAWSPNGKYIASVFYDESTAVRVWLAV